MSIALLEAEQAASAGEVPVGAVVVCGDRLLARSGNRSLRDRDPTAHAEVVVLRAAAMARQSWRLDGCTLYVTVEPCLMCCGALLQARVGRLVFGAREPRTGAVVSAFDTLFESSRVHHVAATEGVLADACAAPMLRFFKQRRDRHTECQ